MSKGSHAELYHSKDDEVNVLGVHGVFTGLENMLH